MLFLLRRIPLLLFLAVAVVWAGLLAYPLRSGLTRSSLLIGLIVLWLLALILARRRRFLVALLIALPAAGAMAILLPGRGYDHAALRASYVRMLRKYEGCRYVWGGETRLGIDCSGLIRVALLDASLRTGLRTANPALLRQAAWLWWHDAAARDLPAYAGRTRSLGPIADIHRADLDPGDFVVTADGTHTLANLGKGEWIEADPDAGRVVRWHVGPGHPGWQGVTVQGVRWRALEVAGPGTEASAPARR